VIDSPRGADRVGAGRDKVALPEGQADISLKIVSMSVKYPG
jgi:hypothetical protein